MLPVPPSTAAGGLDFMLWEGEAFMLIHMVLGRIQLLAGYRVKRAQDLPGY